MALSETMRNRQLTLLRVGNSDFFYSNTYYGSSKLTNNFEKTQCRANGVKIGQFDRYAVYMSNPEGNFFIFSFLIFFEFFRKKINF